ncbi:MAG: helix-turn-helix domain-containing protein [Lachnospiraceae bacterium]|nr:helix-turn-helix domain-containing protein [Lachnospiraceae bacterium]
MKRQDSEISKEQKLSAEHIKSYRNDVLCMKQREFAELIGREKQMVARYEKGETPIPGTIIDRLVSLTGWIREYWNGMTDCKTYEDFYQTAELDALKDLQLINDIKGRKEAQISAALTVFGFRYEDYSVPTPAHDYVSIADNPESKSIRQKIESGCPHKIVSTRTDGSTDSAFFSDAEMSKLLSDISDFIAFRCYQKSQTV